MIIDLHVPTHLMNSYQFGIHSFLWWGIYALSKRAAAALFFFHLNINPEKILQADSAFVS